MTMRWVLVLGLLVLAARWLGGVEVNGFDGTKPPNASQPSAPGELSGIDAQTASANAEADAARSAKSTDASAGFRDLVSLLVHSGTRPNASTRAILADRRHDVEPRHAPTRWSQVPDRCIIEPPWWKTVSLRGMPTVRRMYEDNDSLKKPTWRVHGYNSTAPVRF
jgi:hypothetical protein